MDKVRVQLDFPRSAVKKLDELKVEFELSSRADVIKLALKIFSCLAKEIRDGGKVMLESDSGSVRLMFPLLGTETPPNQTQEKLREASATTK